MKTLLPGTRRKHQALLADIHQAGRAQAQQKTPRPEDSQSADAHMASLLNQDAFEQAFAQAEALSETSRPISPSQTEAPCGSTSVRLQHKRPVKLQQQAFDASQQQNVWPLQNLRHNRARQQASNALRQDRAIIAAAVAMRATPPLAFAANSNSMSLPGTRVVQGDSSVSAFDDSWMRATTDQTASKVKDDSATPWPPKSRL